MGLKLPVLEPPPARIMQSNEDSLMLETETKTLLRRQASENVCKLQDLKVSR